MSENQNPEIETTDDVEGHGFSSGRFRPDEEEMFGEDVQGHGTMRGGLVADEADAVEGHAYTSGRVESDDVEGHVIRGK